jgi:hypothetical protein
MKNKRELSIKNLCIISKVAKRKEVARARLEKTALVPAPIILVPAALALLATFYASYKFVLDMNYGEFINAMAASNFDMASGNFNELSGIELRSWVEKNDVDNFKEYQITVASAGSNGSYNFREAYLFAMDKANIEQIEKNKKSEMYDYQDFLGHPGTEYFKKIMNIEILDWMSIYYKTDVNEIGTAPHKYNFRPALDAYLLENNKRRNEADTNSTNNRRPSKTKGAPGRRAPATDPTARMRSLLISIEIDPGEGTGWTPQLNTAFKKAYNQWKTHPNNQNNQNAPDITQGWQAIAPQLGLTGDITGATALVEKLVALKGNPVETPPAAAATPAPAAAPVDNTVGAKAKLPPNFLV